MFANPAKVLRAARPEPEVPAPPLVFCIQVATVVLMWVIEKSDTFTAWIDSLEDLHGRARILARIERLRAGNPGDVKSLGGGVSELRIKYGPGYRVYFMRRGRVVYLLLCGGDKSSQNRDITFAQAMAKQIKEQYP